MENRRGSFSSFTGNEGKRGFAFSFDAMLSVALLVLVASSISYIPHEKTTDSASKRELQRNAEDALAVLDRGGYLEKADSSVIQSQLQKVMPKNAEWRVLLSEYEFKSNVFSLKEQKSIGATSVPLGQNEIVHGKRIYLKGGKGKISRYGAAEYWAWLK